MPHWTIQRAKSSGTRHLPSFVNFTHEESDTLTWKDKQGEHFLLMAVSDIVKGEEPETRSQSVRITHWLKENEKMMEIWSYEDGEYNCPVDVRTIFRAAPRFSDLNEDGIHELWFMIEKHCKGDISPSTLHVVMFDENARKYILEGEMIQVFPDGSTYGGEYELKDFKASPQKYQDYAVEYFRQNNKEVFVER